MHAAHPIWSILNEQGRRLTWLARKTGYSYAYVKGIKAGTFGAGAQFRRACALALDLPETVLFAGEPVTVRPYRRRARIA